MVAGIPCNVTSGNHDNNTKIYYYDIAKSMPSTLPSNVATDKLKEDFDMSTVHMIMMDSNMDSKDKGYVRCH